MVLVDTSIWIRFMSNREPFATELDGLLSREDVLGHDLVFGELMIGDLGGRRALLATYQGFQRAPIATHDEVVRLVRARQLSGRGIGWIDAHLLASALLERAQLWTADTTLADCARRLGIGHPHA